ncbi:MAG TPA: glycosyltransferase family 4 protein, partial [Chitinophagaceae bacterium]|nr:glycosyltransferase family 4 protein [Chitinophagaceae bacterium]
KHIQPFKFIPTYVSGGPLKLLAAFVASIFKTIGVLASDRSIKIVHIHMASRGSFLRKSVIYGICRLFGKKVFVHVHGAQFQQFYAGAGLLKPLIRTIINGADEVICLSHSWKEYFERCFPKCRVRLIPNSVELPEGGPAPVRRSEGKLQLLFLGYIGDRKGIFDLLQLMADYKTYFRDTLELTIGGNGEVDRLQAFLKQHDLGSMVRYEGWVSGDKKAALLRACDVYILPSYDEGLPVSVLEAMAAGKPVISTYAGGIPDIVHDGRNGRLFPAGDRDALREILTELIANRAVFADYSRNALNMIQAYHPATVNRQLEQAYADHLTTSSPIQSTL